VDDGGDRRRDRRLVAAVDEYRDANDSAPAEAASQNLTFDAIPGSVDAAVPERNRCLDWLEVWLSHAAQMWTDV
jgi:hypothetical protein